MNTTDLRILIGDNTTFTTNAADRLTLRGWNVECIGRDPFELQMKACGEHYDAVIVFSDSLFSAQLCSTLKRYTADCIIISVGRECGADMNLSLPLDDSEVYHKVSDYLSNFIKSDSVLSLDETNIHNKITNIINGLCITPRYSGYNYVREAIKIAVNEAGNTIGISKHIYPEIAKQCSTSPSAVERGMRTAIHQGWKKCPTAMKMNMFGTYATERNYTPTNSEFIFVIADKLNCAMSRTGSDSIR